MSLTTIEVLALIVIVIAIFKIITLLFAPKFFMNFAKKIYSCPQSLKIVAFVLAVIVFYFLVKAGTTVAEILAIFLLLALLIGPAVADYGKGFLEQINPKNVLRKQWFATLIWVILIAWGVYEIFFV